MKRARIVRLTAGSAAQAASPSGRSAKPALFVAETAWKTANQSPSAPPSRAPSASRRASAVRRGESVAVPLWYRRGDRLRRGRGALLPPPGHDRGRAGGEQRRASNCLAGRGGSAAPPPRDRRLRGGHGIRLRQARRRPGGARRVPARGERDRPSSKGPRKSPYRPTPPRRRRPPSGGIAGCRVPGVLEAGGEGSGLPVVDRRLPGPFPAASPQPA